jgi:hypothetical protein
MLTIIKEHDHPSMIDQVDTITRDVGLATMIATMRAINLPQGIGQAVKKEASVETAGFTERMTQEEIGQ